MADEAELTSQAEEKARRAKREARASLPAIYVDTWGTLTWTGLIRFTLGESFSHEDQYRAAFVMEFGDAERFAKHLLDAIKKRQRKDAGEPLDE